MQWLSGTRVAYSPVAAIAKPTKPIATPAKNNESQINSPLRSRSTAVPSYSANGRRTRRIYNPQSATRGLWVALNSRVSKSIAPFLAGAPRTHEICGSSASAAGNPLVSRKSHHLTLDHAFSPTCNSASLMGTLHPPIPQYPSGFFARYCW
jgi:hypothetical protein